MAEEGTTFGLAGAGRAKVLLAVQADVLPRGAVEAHPAGFAALF